MFINHINGVINKNLSLFFFPSDIKLAFKAKQKQRELTKNQLFFISLFFFSKNSGYKEIKNTNFWKGIKKFGGGQVFTIFQTGPCLSNPCARPCCLLCLPNLYSIQPTSIIFDWQCYYRIKYLINTFGKKRRTQFS